MINFFAIYLFYASFQNVLLLVSYLVYSIAIHVPIHLQILNLVGHLYVFINISFIFFHLCVKYNPNTICLRNLLFLFFCRYHHTTRLYIFYFSNCFFIILLLLLYHKLFTYTYIYIFIL